MGTEGRHTYTHIIMRVARNKQKLRPGAGLGFSRSLIVLAFRSLCLASSILQVFKMSKCFTSSSLLIEYVHLHPTTSLSDD